MLYLGCCWFTNTKIEELLNTMRNNKRTSMICSTAIKITTFLLKVTFYIIALICLKYNFNKNYPLFNQISLIPLSEIPHKSNKRYKKNKHILMVLEEGVVIDSLSFSNPTNP